MQDFEKLGAFYLGRRTAADEQELILYDSKDLTTHAVIVGMTGSGKTGLGIDLIEEAAIDHVPVIAIDPKGDLGNLLLTFPELRDADFEPWVDARAAHALGLSVPEHAAKVATTWRQGLAEWGQTPQRLAKLKAAAEARIYTPGSTAGLPVSALAALGSPGSAVMDDPELYRESLDGTTSSLLTLAGIDADPFTSREHILLANVLDHEWRAGRVLSLSALIAAIQSPKLERVGVIDIDTFMPPPDRFSLAMRFNALLASPGSNRWLEGPPLDINRLMFTESGKPCVSVVSIAHLDDAGRMFIVTMLLNALIGWMRRQPGTSSLRAVLYMDEVFGFMPPVANPPSKRLLLTLLKQARAYGLGIVLSTQNPVDLDYKGLANAGTWFIGRMQTERDKARVVEGLKGAAGGEHLPFGQLDATIAGLDKRQFLLHNVHDSEPVVFETRWAMSYLAGPLTREQIKLIAAKTTAPAPASGSPALEASAKRQRARTLVGGARPVLPPEITQRFLPAVDAPPRMGEVLYQAALIAAGELSFADRRRGIDERRAFVLSVAVDDDGANVDWTEAEQLPLSPQQLDTRPLKDASFGECPASLARPQTLRAWEKMLKRELRDRMPLILFKSTVLEEVSLSAESEAEFRIRLQRLGNERRDAEADKLKQRYQKKLEVLAARKRRAEHALEREQQQASSVKLDTVISIGSAVLGALLGRRRVTVTSASRVGSAVRKAGRIRKETGDTDRAEETLDAARNELEELEAEFQTEVAALSAAYSAQDETLEKIVIKPKSTGVHVDVFGIGWTPFTVAADGRLTRA